MTAGNLHQGPCEINSLSITSVTACKITGEEIAPYSMKKIMVSNNNNMGY